MADTSGKGQAEQRWGTGLLGHLYAALYYQAAIIDATNTGAVARAGRLAQAELWMVVEALGGSPEEYTIWAGRRDEALGVSRSGRKG